jgi:hypothetical protein
MYKNNGDGSFAKIDDGAPVSDRYTSVGCAWGDFNNDGAPDLFVSNYNQACSFYKNNGDGTFDKIQDELPVQNVARSVSCAWVDYNNDGYLDLFVTNADNQSNYLYKNSGDGTFTQMTDGEIVTDKYDSHGCSWGDIDRDGDVDLFVCNRDQNNSLYRNNGHQNNWLTLKCLGVQSNHDGIGAKVKLVLTQNGERIVQTKQVCSQSGGYSQSSLDCVFGLGCETRVDSIVVSWPSGIVDRVADIGANQFITVIEGEQIVESKNFIPVLPEDFVVSQNFPNPFNAQTTIAFELPRAGYVDVKIYNARGQEIKTVASEFKNPGKHEVVWDGLDKFGLRASTGLYFYRISYNGQSKAKKMLLIQ